VIYTDGSGFEQGIGAAAIMTVNGTVTNTIKYYLGQDNAHTVYEAEALAVSLALHMLTNSKSKMSKVTIGMDNQAVLMGLRNQKSKPSHYLLDRIHDSLEDFQIAQLRKRGKTIEGYWKSTGRTRLQDGAYGWKEWYLKRWCNVELIWTPGHEGIDGNELADAQAKLAAQGKSSPPSKLPPFLRRKPLPTSISATRQTLKKRLKQKWKDEWSNSPRHNRLHAIDSSLPSDDYLHIIGQLKRNQASLLIQFRTGHIPLNVVLHRIKKADSPHCPHCGGNFKESIFHFLLACPHYATARRALQAKLGRKASEITFLIGKRAGIPHFIRFVSATKRLSATFGEVRPDDDFVIKDKNTDP
jgi:ribonuclease HI